MTCVYKEYTAKIKMIQGALIIAKIVVFIRL